MTYAYAPSVYQNFMEEKNREMFKPMRRLKKDAKGISPLIATLLLIAIAVAASVITYSWVMSMIGSQSTQAQTAVRIDNVAFNVTSDSVSVTIRNIGSVSADIVTVGVKLTSASSYTTADIIPARAIAVGTADEVTVSLTELDLQTGYNYDVKVITSTGFENVKTNLAP
jgi:flagellin-like protein